MILQPVFDIAEICSKKGVKKVIICPGSRNAPLTLAFARHPHINCYSVPDERSAAFIGLGMAIKSKSPVVVLCTSGSAAYNFAPAVAEAFFSQIPLIILTADRPQEWIGQLDGQTIYQENIFGKHVKASHTYPSDYENKDVVWHCHRLINESINLACEYPFGPVHINVPLREPFYPKENEKTNYSADIKITELEIVESIIGKLTPEISAYQNILIIGGQNQNNPELSSVLSDLSEKFKIPIIADVISNLHKVKKSITAQDIFLKNKGNFEKLKPELIISFGKSVISKNLKLFLRQVKPTQHWHIQPAGEVADTFQSLTKIIRCNPIVYFRHILQNEDIKAQNVYYNNWQKVNARAKEKLEKQLSSSNVFSEFKAFKNVIDELPNHIDLHLANSMAIRYVNFIGLDKKTDVEVFANRGTSGIDGSVSTALGAALSSKREVYIMIGDMAFFYDRNAFWHNDLPSNLKIVLFNNHGGGIFRMIDGPSKQPELKEFFETDQKLNAGHLSNEFDLNYTLCSNMTELTNGISQLVKPSTKPFILEIETNSEVNKKVYKEII
ncbi:MAG: 2-succinyl-5-enolpyruvyl-6-hydroxy-3-cyclohexene-1-carboxylate synthase [Cyclobacteriaceae bacterium]|jgi:2-succinyl-5-enolpyruvyl-6-hydroxy-3-cyclohexene-1-carboxylate synthase